MSDETVELLHRDGSVWTLTSSGLTATIVMIRRGRETRTVKTFTSAPQLERFRQEGRKQMVGAGFYPADGLLAARHDLRARAIAELARGIPDLPEAVRLWTTWDTDALQYELRWLLKEGNEAALVALSAHPQARHVLVRQCATSADDWHHQMAAWIAVMTRSELIVPLLRLERLRDEGDLGSNVAAMSFEELLSRSTYSAVELLDRSSHGVPEAGVHALYASMAMRRLPAPPFLDDVLAYLSALEVALAPS
jgi:hypothetical protein